MSVWLSGNMLVSNQIKYSFIKKDDKTHLGQKEQ